MQNNKYALVTGAGSGIGRAVSLALLQNGWHVALVGRNQANLEETATLAAEFQSNSLVITADITNPKSVLNLFEKVKIEFGRLDLLFNNAGTNTKGLLEDISFEEWRKVLDTNLSGAFYCTQQAFKIMKNQEPMGGRIINNGSISATAPRPNSAPYTATKHAITGLTKSTSLDGRKYNIACGQIDIGNADTAMAATMKTGMPQADESTKIEPTMDLKHVSDAILYMAGLPLEANVQFMTVMATQMPLIGRG
jgi:NAD(P)-dependent dehydrogenase (short-subunit alcohol dehydrogenase family)